MTTPRSDLDDLTAGVPPVLAEVLRAALVDDADLEEAALLLLAQSLENEHSRAGAWPLLGGDALITVLCDRALEHAENPEIGLSAVFRRCAGGQ